MSRPIIEISNLSFSFEDRPVLDKVNLTVAEHDSVCIVGPNGGGKTTLLKIILGLLAPDQGEVLVLGEKPDQARLRIGYVPQYSHYDPRFPVTVLDVVLMGRLGHRRVGFYSKEDRNSAMDALATMELSNMADSIFSEISGGQRQRVLIARALTCAEELLILDEPTANIDIHTEMNFFKKLEELNDRMAILMVTHDVGFVSRFFKRVACVNRQVAIHPVSNLTGQLIQDMYHGDVRMVRHDHSCIVRGDCHE